MASSLNRMGPSVNKCIIYIDHLPVKTFYLATVEGDQPHVRPFGAVCEFEGKLYIQTGKVKDVSKQLHQNPKAEICAFKNGEWLRVSGKLIEDDRNEARQSMLDAYPSLQKMYKADDGNTKRNGKYS